MINRDKNGNITGITQTWSREDIEDRFAEKNILLYPQKVIDNILESLDKRFDASIGVNWDVIDTYIEMEMDNYPTVKVELDP